MIQQLIPPFVAAILVIPIILFFKKSKPDLLLTIMIIVTYQLIYSTLLLFPIEFGLQIPNTSMNWIGKFLALAYSFGFFFFIKERINENNFLNTSFPEGSLRKVALTGATILIVMCALTVLFSKAKPLSLERLAYQLTMPGLDEELWRGMLLALMIPLVRNEKYRLGHPAVWATTIIFALVHSLYLTNGNFGFAVDAFIVTGVLGYILGWTILKSRSILPAIILHNLINFSTNFIEMVIL